MSKPPVAKGSAEERILAEIRAIPRGEVAGYGEVARRAGLPGRARLVARLLSQNGDRGLPWHRVLRSDGRIALPEGSKGFREQSQRLRAEGVRVEGGRVRGQRAAATPEEVLDEQVWGADAMRAPAVRSTVRRAPAASRGKPSAEVKAGVKKTVKKRSAKPAK